jgi:ABC-2 type transport system permease protein
MNFGVIWALVTRYLYLYTRSWIRVVELVFWPFMELLVWGSMTIFLGEKAEGMSVVVKWFLGGVIFWDVVFRSQQAIAISFLEDVWTKNLLNIFMAPVRMTEYVAAGMVVGVLRTSVVVLVLGVISAISYQFNLWQLHWQLVPLFGSLMIFGWALGMVSCGLILKWGQAAEALAWAVPYLIQPAAAVFYPLAVLPGWAQVIGRSLPCTHVFEGMRAILDGKPFPWGLFWTSMGLNLVWMVLAAGFYAWIIEQGKRDGMLTKFSSH